VRSFISANARPLLSLSLCLCKIQSSKQKIQINGDKILGSLSSSSELRIFSLEPISRANLQAFLRHFSNSAHSFTFPLPDPILFFINLTFFLKKKKNQRSFGGGGGLAPTGHPLAPSLYSGFGGLIIPKKPTLQTNFKKLGGRITPLPANPKVQSNIFFSFFLVALWGWLDES
jgi:hypothetical protein